MQEIGEDIFVATEYYGANVGCIVTYDGAILVDAPIIPSEARDWRRKLEHETGAEFLYIFHTDGHPNHVIGNEHIPAKPIVNERAFRSMSRFTPTMRDRILDNFRDWAPHVVEELAEFEVNPPEITFNEGLTLYKGDRTLRAIRLGGHTPATSVLFVAGNGVLFSGDLLVNGPPPYIGQGDSREWLEALGRIRALNPQVIVPGHGPVGGLELVDEMESFLLRLREGVEELLLEGRSRAEAATRMLHLLDEFEVGEEWRKRAERSFRQSVARIYEEVKMEQSGESAQ